MTWVCIVSAKRTNCEQIPAPCQSTILIGLVSKVKNQAFPSLFSTNFLLVFHKTLYLFCATNQRIKSNIVINLTKNPHDNANSAYFAIVSVFGTAHHQIFVKFSSHSVPKFPLQISPLAHKKPPLATHSKGGLREYRFTSDRCRSEDPVPHRSAGSGRCGRYRPHQTSG